MGHSHRAGFDRHRGRASGSLLADVLLVGCIAVAALAALLTGLSPAVASGADEFAEYPPGTVVVSQSRRRLFLVTGYGAPVSYPVAVGRSGKQWRGTVAIDGKYRYPAWAPPAEVKRAEPWLPAYIPGGSPRNPMGMRALTLTGGEYAIHGTNRPNSIGTEASFGCIRMYNRDIVDLFERVEVGTPVVVTR